MGAHASTPPSHRYGKSPPVRSGRASKVLLARLQHSWCSLFTQGVAGKAPHDDILTGFADDAVYQLGHGVLLVLYPGLLEQDLCAKLLLYLTFDDLLALLRRALLHL